MTQAPGDDLPELDVEALLDVLESDAPAPAAGSAAALAAAMAAGLVAKVARRSGDVWPEAAGAAAQARALRLRAAPLAVEDARAYTAALRRLELREGVDHLLGAALDEAAAVPLRIARAAADVAVLAHETAARCDPALRPDAVAAAFLAVGATRAAAHLVEVNLSATADDPRVSEARAYVTAAAGDASTYG